MAGAFRSKGIFFETGAFSGSGAFSRYLEVSPPAGFTMPLPGRITFDSLLNRYDMGVNLSSYDAPRSVTYYVDPINGVDANNGLSSGSPKKTLSTLMTAVAAANVSTKINIVAGGYSGPWVNQNISADLSIVCTNGTAYFSNARVGSDYSLHSGACYVRAGQSVSMVVDFANPYQPFNQPTQLISVATIAEVIATPNTFAVVSGACYIHAFDSRVPDGKIMGVPSSANTVGRWSGAGSLYLKGITLVGGANGSLNITTAGTPSVVLDNCEFHLSGRAGVYTNCNGLGYVGGGTVILNRCGALAAKKDGFNYHENGGISANVTEIDCYSDGCGGEDDSCNATTMHDAGKITRLNGDYRNAQDRIVHDVGDSLSWNLGCKSNNPFGIGPTQSISFACGVPNDAADDSLMWLERCTGVGAETGLAAWGNANARIFTRRSSIAGAVINPSKVVEY